MGVQELSQPIVVLPVFLYRFPHGFRFLNLELLPDGSFRAFNDPLQNGRPGLFEQVVRIVLDVVFPGNPGVEGNDNQPPPGAVIVGGHFRQVVGVKDQCVGGDEMEGSLEFLLRFDGVHRTDLLHHPRIEPLAFFQFGSDDQPLPFQFCNFRFYVSPAVHGHGLGGNLAGIQPQHPGDGVPEGRFPVGPAAIGDNHLFGIDSAHCGHPHDLLHVPDQLLVLAEEQVQAFLPHVSSLGSGRAGGDFGDHVIRVMGPFSLHPFGKVVGGFRGVQKFRIIVQLGNIQGQHGGSGILDIENVLVVPVFHDEFLVSIRAEKGRQQMDFFPGNLVGQGLASGLHVFPGDPDGGQVIFCLADLFFCVCQLVIHKVLDDAQRLMFIFIPVITHVGDVLRSTGVPKASHTGPGQDFGFPDIREVIRLEGRVANSFVVFIRGHIPLALLDFVPEELQGTFPDGVQLFFRKLRFAILSPLQVGFVGFFRIPIPLQHSAGKVGHGVVPVAFRDRTPGIEGRFRLVGFQRSQAGQKIRDGLLPFLP